MHLHRTAPRSRGRHYRRTLAAFVTLALAAATAAATQRADAAASALVQTTPGSSVAVAGHAVATYIQMAGATGHITFTQRTGTPNLHVNSSGYLTAGTSLAAGTYQATGSAVDTAGVTGSWSL